MAERIDLSASHLSQIEQGKKMPSLVALTDIAEALDINPRDLLEPETDQVYISQTPKRAVTPEPTPLISSPLLTSLTSGSDLEVRKLTMQPDAPSLEFEPHSGEVLGYVLAGRLTITLEEEHIELSAGDSIHYDANQPYSLQGQGESPCVVIWCSSPPWNDLEQKIAAVLGDNADVSTVVQVT
jgi:mannose-6-phosphate isomerase-like protein (cupin superfamily)